MRRVLLFLLVSVALSGAFDARSMDRPVGVEEGGGSSKDNIPPPCPPCFV